MNIDWKKWSGYILFVATVIGWIFYAGQQSGKINTLEKTIEKMESEVHEMYSLMLEQQELNGKIIQYMEQ
jgi:hypothetical protein